MLKMQKYIFLMSLVLYCYLEHILELEALMNVEAYTLSESASSDTLLYGTTVIRLMRGKTIYKNIEILP